MREQYAPAVTDSGLQPSAYRQYLFLFALACVEIVTGAEKKLDWESLPDLPNPVGMAGPFVGVHNDALIVAGGANFPVPEGKVLWEVDKVYYGSAWVLTREKVDSKHVYEWNTGFKLKQPVAYGMCVSTDKGVVCIGGQTGELVYSEVFETRSESMQRETALKKLKSKQAIQELLDSSRS